MNNDPFNGMRALNHCKLMQVGFLKGSLKALHDQFQILMILKNVNHFNRSLPNGKLDFMRTNSSCANCSNKARTETSGFPVGTLLPDF